MNIPKIEIGEINHEWYVFIDGLPMGQPAESKEAAYHAAKWLDDLGGYALISQQVTNYCVHTIQNALNVPIFEKL